MGTCFSSQYYFSLGKIRSGCKKKEKPSSEKNWQKELANELHKPIKRNFTRRRVIVNHIDEIWCSDLVGMQQFSKWNKGYRYLLMVLDVFSKYGWIIPLKDKKGETVMHLNQSSRKVENHSIYGLIRVKNITTYSRPLG